MMKIDLKRIVVNGNRGSKSSFIRVSSNGQIALSHALVEEMEIKEGQKAVFFQDQATPEKWYFGFGDDGDYELRGTGKKGDKTLLFGRSGLRDLILLSMHLPKKASVRLEVAKEPYEVHGAKLYELREKI